MTKRSGVLAAFVAFATAAACVGGGGDEGADGTIASQTGGNCIVVDIATSPEKIDLLTELARDFQGTGTEVNGSCIQVRPSRKSSGGAMAALAKGWDEAVDGPRPVVWSPASSAWGAVLNQRLESQGKPALVGEGEPFMLTPLVIAMPRPMAEALGWPDKALGWSDILSLASSNRGWADFGHPEWGQFRLGKTNPNYSTSGLSALIAQTYASTGKTSGLSAEDLLRPETEAYARGVESAVVHYGDTTLTFLNNWARADRRGTALLYVSAAAVEEKSVIDYNAGNPDGVLDPGEQPQKPRVPLVAIYPKEGTLYSDNPFFVVDADWVSEDEKAAAAAFSEFVQRPENQEKVLRFGFRPGNPDVAIGAPIVAANGVDPTQPQTLLDVPTPRIMDALLTRWDLQRKEARVLMVIDVSGSMGDAAGGGSRETKLDLAKRAAINALDLFKDTDEVGLRVFTTDPNAGNTPVIRDLLPIEPIGPNKERVRREIDALFPVAGTPLYDVAQQSFADVLSGYRADRINAVVLLTDGRNDDGRRDDDETQRTTLITTLRQATDGETGRPVRVFPIAYGQEADLDTLRQVAEATNAAVYDAGNPASIDAVFTSVISNF